MRYLFVLLSVIISISVRAQQPWGGVGQRLQLKGKVFLVPRSDRDSVATPTGGCAFIDYATGELKLVACGSGGGGGTYTPGNGIGITSNVVSLGDLNMSSPVSFGHNSTRVNWKWLSSDTMIYDALHFQIYREASILSNGTGVLKFGAVASPGDAFISYNNGTGDITFGAKSGVTPIFQASNTEFMRSDFSQRLLVGYTSNNGSGRLFQVNGGGYFNGPINIVDGNQTVGWVWTCTNATTGAGEWQAASGGGGTTYSIGALDSLSKSANGIQIASTKIVPQTADATHPGYISSTTQALAGVKTWSNVLKYSTDLIGSYDDRTLIDFGNAKKLVNDSFNAFRANLETSKVTTIETTDALTVDVDTVYFASGSDIVNITVTVNCNSVRLDGSGGSYDSEKKRSFYYNGTSWQARTITSNPSDEYDDDGGLATCTFSIEIDGNYIMVKWSGESLKDIHSSFTRVINNKMLFLP